MTGIHIDSGLDRPAVGRSVPMRSGVGVAEDVTSISSSTTIQGCVRAMLSTRRAISSGDTGTNSKDTAVSLTSGL
jgi:hypothetical protein